MKVLVLGDGILASEIVNQTGWDYVSRKKDELEISDYMDVYDKIYDSNCDVLVNCIACTNTYDFDKTEHWEVNYKFVSDLVDICNVLRIKLVHISSEYIYANSVHCATENDVPCHVNTWYGYTKLLGDAHVQLKSNHYLICRELHKPYPFPFKSAWNNVRTNGDFTPVISKMIIKLIETEAFGVYNVGTEEKSIYDLVFEEFPNVEPISAPDFVPDNTTMDLSKLNKWINEN